MTREDRTSVAPQQVCLHSPLRNSKRLFFLLSAGLFFMLATVGIFVPGLPTTPFLLLTSYFLARSSPQLNAMLLRSKLFGPILTDWQVHGGIRRDVKVKAVSVVIIVVLLTLCFSDSVWQCVVVSLLAIPGIGVIIRLPVAKGNDSMESE